MGVHDETYRWWLNRGFKYGQDASGNREVPFLLGKISFIRGNFFGFHSWYFEQILLI